MIKAAIMLMMLHPFAAQGQSMSPPAQSPSATPPPSGVPAPVPDYATNAPIFPIGPIGAWEADQGEVGSCSVSRNYGSAERPETVALQSRAITPKGLAIYIVSSGVGGGPRGGEGALRLDPGTTIPGHYTSFDVPVRNQRFTELYVDRTELGALKAARTVAIQADRTKTIAASDIKAAIDSNDRCLKQLYQSWGIDASRFDFDRPKPTATGEGPITWFDAEKDYPMNARKAGIQGRVVIVLDVGKDGAVKSCHIAISADPDLDAVSCQDAMERASFRPAVDAKGAPVASIILIPVRWSIQP